MSIAPIDAERIRRIFAPRDPAASLRESAMQFAAMGRDFDAEFTADLARQAASNPDLFGTFALEQAARVERFLGEGQ
jgi:hypothetical protein